MLNTQIAADAVLGFPRKQIDHAFYEAVVRTPSRVVDDARGEATAALYAAVYRHRNAREAAEALLPLTSRSAQPLWRYRIQTLLFDLVVGLNSAVESSAYGLYFIGSAIAPAGHEFTLAASDKRKKIKLESTAKAYTSAWPDEGLANALTELPLDPDYKVLLERRNFLAHRVAPGLEFRQTLTVGSPGDEYIVAVFGEPLTELVDQTLAHAERLLDGLWTAAEDFAVLHSSEFRL
ncbi:hypothetical protein QD712_30245 [Streptomyces acidiscabies]|uniref:hypothetical protein n=1 Tax=Streptomyces acidiscabies TaxID=42234 RepID=UPI0030D3AEFA